MSELDIFIAAKIERKRLARVVVDLRAYKVAREILAWMKQHPISQQELDEFVARFGPFKRLKDA